MAKKRKGKSNYDKKQEQQKELQEAVVNSAENVTLEEPNDFEAEEPIVVLKRWWNKYGINIALVIALVVAAYVVIQWYQGSQQRGKDAAWGEYAAAITPNDLGNVAQTTDNPDIRNWARLTGAIERLRRLGTYDTGNNDLALNPDAKREIDAAESNIKLFMEETPDRLASDTPNENKINAYFNLGKAYENLNNFDQAEAQYKAGMAIIDQWVTDAKVTETKHAFIHKYRLLEQATEDLTILRQKIHFPDAPPVEDQAATTQPATTQPASTQPAVINTTQPSATTQPAE